MKKGYICLEDGTFLSGLSVGSEGTVVGELVFNTSMTGYQEIMTDPSYAGQIVLFTYPHIGNYGTNPKYEESDFHIKAIIARHINRYLGGPSSEKGIIDYLQDNNIFALEDVDTRFLTKKIREKGVIKVALSDEISEKDKLMNLLQKHPDIQALNLVEQVSCKSAYQFADFKSNNPHLILMDFGVKKSIARFLVEAGFNVTIVPHDFSCEEIKKLKPDAIFLSNGPGDPKNVKNGIEVARYFLRAIPILGICLGHQILALATGGDTKKLKFGHHGANHPVKSLITGKIYITSQNHNFAVCKIPENTDVTMINLYDNTIEGLASKKLRFLSVQFHPEASPGPLEARSLFQDFKKFVDKGSLILEG